MKLGLLVALAAAVAVLGPSLSESRIVSRCELKEKLSAAITLPKVYNAWKDKFLARAICELHRRSGLNTDLIRVFGHRVPTTTVAPTTMPAASNGTITDGMPPSVAPTTTTTTTTADITTTTTTADTTTTTTTADTTTTAPPAVVITNSTLTNSTGGGSRRKRSAPEIDENMEAMLYDKQDVLDEEELEEDYNHVQDEDDEEEEESIEGMARVKRDRGGRSKEDSSEERKPRRKSKKQKLPWSIGYYGLFQLSDGHFCNSGYRWSRNVCNTTCTAFADDNITDDIECFVSSGYWWYILRKVSRKCFRATDFLDEC